MKDNFSEKTRLERKFSFWYHILDSSILGGVQLDKDEYENQVKKIAEFETVEDFWAIYQYLKKPDKSKPGVDFQLFKENIKPMWEDKENMNGGKFSIKIKKDNTSVVWEELVLAFIGGVIPQKDEICGIVVSIRKEFNIIQVWIRNFGNKNVVNEVEQNLRELLQIPENVQVEARAFFKNSTQKAEVHPRKDK